MPPTRRQVVNAIAAGAFVPGTVATAEAQDGEDQSFSPDVSINPNNLVATVGERDGDVDPDTVTIYTANGDEHEFDGAAPNEWESGEAFEIGYTHDDSRARIEGWHGVIAGVTATKDGETVSATNDRQSSLDVTCSLWKTPDRPPTEFEVFSEGARKAHFSRGDDDLSEEQRQYGSPGRALQTVAERNPEIAMRVEFDGCDPETEKALRFDCTTVTVEPEELNQGEDRIEDVQLRFADGTFESPPGTADDADNGAYELPVTLSGSGDNEGKVIDRLEFKVPGGEYTYWNLEADQCSTGADDGSGDGTSDGGDANDGGDADDGSNTDDSENTDDGTTDSGSGDGSDDGTGDDSQDQGPGADSDDGSQSSGGTETPDGSSSSDDGAGSQGGSDAEGGSGGGSGSTDSSTTEDSGGILDSDSEDATETPTPDGSNQENVTVNGSGGSGENGTATADGSGRSGNGSDGADNGSANGSDDPGIATGTPAEDQAGFGVAAALGGLLGAGRLAQRKLTGDDES